MEKYIHKYNIGTHISITGGILKNLSKLDKE
jgi:hypothetical protein